MINFPDHFLFFYFFLYFKICKYDKDKWYFLFLFLLEKWKIRLAEVCTDPNAGQVISFRQWSFVSFPDVDVIHIQYTDAKPMKSFAPMETS